MFYQILFIPTVIQWNLLCILNRASQKQITGIIPTTVSACLTVAGLVPIICITVHIFYWLVKDVLHYTYIQVDKRERKK